MGSSSSYEQEMRDAVCAGRAIIVAGTGVSIAASADPATGMPHPQASWGGLLKDGLKWLESSGHGWLKKAQAHLIILSDNPESHHFITAAHDVTKGMGGAGSVYFTEWLERTVGDIKAHNRSMPDALEALRRQGNLLATTNYDDVLLDDHLAPVTWQDSAIFLGAVRGKERDKIIYLHGHWRYPESVILDWRSYDQIARNEQYREDLLAIWKTRTWVYVGCGINGLNDPDFGLLLDRYGRRANDAGHLNFCLVLKSQKTEFQAYFDNNNFNIRAVSFGEKHEDLAPYLQSLLPAPAKPVATVAPIAVVPVAGSSLSEQSAYTKSEFVSHSSLFVTNDDLGFDQQVMVNHGVDCLDKPSLDTLLNSELVLDALERSDFVSGREKNIEDQLEQLGLVNSKKLLLGTFLCLASERELSKTFSGCGLHLANYTGIDRESGNSGIYPYGGNLINLFREGIKWLKNRSGLRRNGKAGDDNRDDLEIPIAVLREALANALIHRNYQDKSHRQQPTRIEVFLNRVEITSYGSLPKGLTVQSLNNAFAEVRSIRQNPIIARIMLTAKHAELNAIGITRMKRRMTEAGLELPRYIYDEAQEILTIILNRPAVQYGMVMANEASANAQLHDANSNDGIQKESSPPGSLSAMISSSVQDLPGHRKAAVDACIASHIFPLVLETLPGTDNLVIDASQNLVGQSDIFIGIYGRRYGWIPAKDNSGQVSILEMEYNWANERLGNGGLKAILIFLMDDAHPVRISEIENDHEGQIKLEVFKQRLIEEHDVKWFKSKEELRDGIVAEMARLKSNAEITPKFASKTAFPKPPAFYAAPDYIGSHRFVGRKAQLQMLSDWAAPSDQTNLLIFEAIGGNGKSMLTWEWARNYANAARPADAPWAGRFWYSFYERGAIMTDFCQHALAYMTGRPLADYARKKTAELKDELIAQLHARPWLFILDGMERVLVAYHRIDAAELRDEEVNAPTDKIVNRNPSDTIRDEDNELLRALATAMPSKLLITSRLTPRVLLNPSGQPIPGAKRITLPGLRPPDAEALLRSCGIEGSSTAIQAYLTSNCDNHPLIIGILGGLIANYMPTRGNFDAWAAAADGGAALDLSTLDIIQRRNHILKAAINDLSLESTELLSTLALLNESVDYETLKALNPFISDDPKRLDFTIKDLEQRGLLQWDGHERTYDLHPVVRSIASGAMAVSERNRQGQRVVDHFNTQPHRHYDEAETVDDVHNGLHVVRTLLKLDRFQEAVDIYKGELSNALIFNLNAYAEVLSLLKPFFPHGWDKLPMGITKEDSSYLANGAAIALDAYGEPAVALVAYGLSMHIDLKEQNWRNVCAYLRNVSANLSGRNRLAQAIRFNLISLDIATLERDNEADFMCNLFLFEQQAKLGQWDEASRTWQVVEAMGRNWSRSTYRSGMAELENARFHFLRGTLSEKLLIDTENLVRKGKDRGLIRALYRLRGNWRLEQGNWELAESGYHEAVRLARERSLTDAISETGLALAKYHLGQLSLPTEEAERLTQLRYPAHRYLAMLWLAIGDDEKAKYHGLAAYRWAWADGEPYVHRYELDKTIELLNQLNVANPVLPPYDPAKYEPLPWEGELMAAIEGLRAKKKAEQKKGSEL
jgi:tetratricopeptide (TPR) repeat protein